MKTDPYCSRLTRFQNSLDLGRVSMFTSGAENLHYVEKVTQGTRFALTIAFTCDEKHAIPDPLVQLND